MQTAKLFINGRSQAVRLPKEFQFTGDDVLIQKSWRGGNIGSEKQGLERIFRRIERVFR
ncbi:Antidote-toxin recognition MazE [Leptospira interrogans serovar Canicola]|nr:Antidote-toxin recognition MazE [Leptospira interrogans serovar Canicola]